MVLDKKRSFKLSKRTIIWMCIIFAIFLTVGVVLAEGIASRNENVYSIETSKLHIYNS